MTYSIAIRTLGTAGDKFRRELESIKRQTIQPDKVIVYIANGFPRPDFQIGKEEYIWVEKGMMAQRLLSYEEIDSDLIFFLDDDVELAPDSAERMLQALQTHHADAIGADVFMNHNMSLKTKFRAAISNLVFPHFNDKWAFKICRNGSFSYLNRPRKDFYLSQSCGGPAWMIKKSVYDKLRYKDELWLESFGFTYCEDQLETYKIFKNGYKLGVLYNSGICNLDAKTDSQNYHKNKNKVYIRTKALYTIWWRTIFSSSSSNSRKYLAMMSFMTKTIWSLLPVTIFSITSLSLSPITQFVKGNIDGYLYTRSPKFSSLSPYILLPAKKL